jgi:predicted RNase H-like HicB family nuclease
MTSILAPKLGRCFQFQGMIVKSFPLVLLRVCRRKQVCKKTCCFYFKMKKITAMKFTAIVEKGKDGMFSIYVDGMKNHGLYGSGATVEKAKEDMINALNEMVEVYKEEESKIPNELDNPTFIYKYDIASMFDYFDWINVTKLAMKAGINSSLMRQYKNGLAFASEKQCAKIQEALNNLGRELSTALCH